MRFKLMAVLLMLCGLMFAQRPGNPQGAGVNDMGQLYPTAGVIPNDITDTIKAPPKMAIWAGYGREVGTISPPPDTGMVLIAVPGKSFGRLPAAYWEYIENIKAFDVTLTTDQLQEIIQQIQTEGFSTQREISLSPASGISAIQLNFDPDDNRPVQVYRNGVICQTCTFNDNSPADATLTISPATEAGELFFITYYLNN